MADFYYLYDPADNLALGQAIHLANTDGGMSYIVPFANKSGAIEPNDLASAGLGVIETAIAAGPLNGGGNDPVSNRLTPTQFQNKLSDPAKWAAIKAMIKASIDQAPPAGWNEVSLEAADTTFSVISADAYNQTNQLNTHIFDGIDRIWKDADTSNGNPRGNPYIAFGGRVTDSAFIDYAGHHIPTATLTGEIILSPSGQLNVGDLYGKRGEKDLEVGRDSGSVAYGLTIDPGVGKGVILANFSATSQVLAEAKAATDDLGFTRVGNKAASEALHIFSGDVTIAGQFIIDQFGQVTNGTYSSPGAVMISGSNTRVTFDKTQAFLGSVRGYQSLIDVSQGAILDFNGSTIYGFASSNSDAPTMFGQGLDWGRFWTKDGSAAIDHLINVRDSGRAVLTDSRFLREDSRQAMGAYAQTATSMTLAKWTDNDYKTISDGGDLNVSGLGTLEIVNSKVLGSITTKNGGGTLRIKDSVVAGLPVGTQQGKSLVQLTSGSITIENSLIDSLDAVMLGGGSVGITKDSHILATATPWEVSTTTDPNYSSLTTFANSSTQQVLEAWADKDSGNAAKVKFEYVGPTDTLKTPSGASRKLGVLLREASLPQVAASGATTFFLTASFDEPISGFDDVDVKAALGAAAIAAGWQVSAAPVTRDGGKNWSFQLLSPTSFGSAVSLQLAAGAANATLVTGLTSEPSNSFTLLPVGSSSGGGGNSGGGGSSSGGSGSSGAAQPPSTPGGGTASTPGLDNDNLDESTQNNNGIVIDANKDGTPDANQSNVAGIRRVGDGTSPGDYAALAVAADYTLNAVTLLPITNNQVQVSLPSGGSITTPIPNGVKALLEPLEFYVENVRPGATIDAELFIPDNFGEQTDAYMRFNYQTKRFEEYLDPNGTKLYQLLDENADGKVDRVVFTLTDGDPRWDGDGIANGVIIDPGSPIDARLNFAGRSKKDSITGNLLGNTIKGKAANDRLLGDLGNDLIKGGTGNDRIDGGEQGDLLIGGRGRDKFIYHSAADSSADNINQQDEIRRFHRQDRIDLRRFDADDTQGGRQAFTFIGSRSFTGDAGELRFKAGLLSADLDGNRKADFAVAVDGALQANQLLL